MTANPTVLGNVFLNTPKVFNIDITNNELLTANITEIFVGCQSCTTVSMPKRTLYANETAKVQVTFTPKTLGAHNKSITIKYKTAEKESKVVLGFTANVVK